jgi:hypothetical protein
MALRQYCPNGVQPVMASVQATASSQRALIRVDGMLALLCMNRLADAHEEPGTIALTPRIGTKSPRP